MMPHVFPPFPERKEFDIFATMDPAKRTLIQVTIEDAALCERRISVLMGNNAEIRRKWIDDNIDFTLEEDYRVTRNG